MSSLCSEDPKLTEEQKEFVRNMETASQTIVKLRFLLQSWQSQNRWFGDFLDRYEMSILIDEMSTAFVKSVADYLQGASEPRTS
jgi:hypothetical protein